MRALRDRGRAIGLAAIALISGVAGGGVLATARSGDAELLGEGLILGAVVSTLIAGQRVVVTDDGVQLQYPFHKRFIPWKEIICFKVADVKNPMGERLRKPAVLTLAGRTHALPGADRFSFLQRETTYPLIDELERERMNRKSSGWRG